MLLWFVNTWIGRRILCIREPLSRRIEALIPNAYAWHNPNGSVIAKFYSKPNIAILLFREFKFLWRLLHFLDDFLLDRWAPAWSFGFATFEPDPDPESSSCDGFVETFDALETATWAFIRGAGYSKIPYDDSIDMFAAVSAGQYADGFTLLDRTILIFDTSAIGALATILSASCDLYCISKWADFGSNKLIYCPVTTAANTSLAGADINNFTLGSGKYCDATVLIVSSGNDIALNAAGENNINKTGVTKIGVVFEDDYEDTDPGTWSAYESCGFSLSAAEGSVAPVLTVTYLGGSKPGANMFMFE